ncbi:MAG: hypothetical protein K6D97_04685 [Clostridia bacterium]|nr:hypothetical protein [Clostridia bacterium]
MSKFDADGSAVDEMLDGDESNNSGSFATKATDKAKSELKNKAANEVKKKVTQEAGKKVAASVAKKSLLAAVAPYLAIAAAIILAIIIMVGIATFLITMPGMLMDSIKDTAKGWVEKLVSFFGVDSTTMIDEEDINPVLDTLESMGYDIKGYGFLTEYATSSDASGNAYLDTDTGVARYSEDSGEHPADSIKVAYSDFMFTYLMSDNYMYTIKNFNLDTQGGNHWYNKLFAVIKGYYVRLLDRFTNHYFSEAWGKGMIAIYYEDGFGRKGNFYQNSLTNNIKINTEKKTLTIKKGLFGKEIQYNLDGWTGRYGVPLEFLIAIHMGTMMPDLSYSLASSFPTEVIMLLHSSGDTYTPYISAVENHWYRDVYFVKEDKPFIQVDEEYEDVMKERWTLYETFDTGRLRGEYKLYAVNAAGDYATSTSEIRNYSNASDKFTHENGMYLFNGTIDEASEYGLDVTKKAIAKTYTDEMYENIEWNNVDGIWTAYEVDGESVKQTGEAMRGETNSTIKKLFLYNTYFRYDGTQDTAEAITKLRNENDIEYGALDLKYDLSQDSSALENVKTEIESEDGTKKTYSLKDVSGKVVFNQDSLNAFSMLENTHTVDADYIYRDFKELAVELGYFGKSELAESTPRLLAWPVPDTGSYMYPYRTIDKRENEFGSMIHSKGDIDACKKKELLELLKGIEESITQGETSNDPPADEPTALAPINQTQTLAKVGNPVDKLQKLTISTQGEKRKLLADGEGVDPSEVSLEEFLEAADKVHKDIEDNHFTYSQGGGNQTNYESALNSGKMVDCSAYVSWVLQEVGILPKSEKDYTGDPGSKSGGLSGRFAEYLITKEESGGLQPGDIPISSSHVQINGEEKDGAWVQYNAGSTNAIQSRPSAYEPDFYTHIIRFSLGPGKSNPYKGYEGNEAVVSPVTGVLLDYGTYGDSEAEKEERTNVDMKYGMPYAAGISSTDSTTENAQNVIDKVGYAKILVLDAEYYKKLEKKTGSHWANNSLVNENNTTNTAKRLLDESSLKTKDDLDDGMWNNLNKTVYGYKEFAEKYEIGGIAGNIIYIDGFICQDVDESVEDLEEEIPNGDPISIEDFDVSVDDEDNQRLTLYEPEQKRRFIQKDYTERVEAENITKKEAASSLKISDNGKDLIYIKEGTVLGRTMSDKELLEAGYLRGGATGSFDDIRKVGENEEEKLIGNYLRIIFRNKDDTVVENVEDYMRLDEPDEIKTPIDLLTNDYPIDQKVKIIMDYLIQEQGFTMEAAAGLVGNLMLESGIMGDADNESHFGICQWDYTGSPESPSSGRWQRVNNYLSENGFDYVHLGGQVKAIFESEDYDANKDAVDGMRQQTDPREAAKYWDDTYERSGGQGLDKRMEYAESAIEIYQGSRDSF